MPLLRSAFIALSTNKPLRRFSESSSLGRRLSSRFVAGLEIDDALRIAESLNNRGFLVSLDSLGESVTSEEEAQQSAGIYHLLLEEIKSRGLRANISVKLTQMGLELDPELAMKIAVGLTEHCRATGSFLRIDMEGSQLTQVTLDLVRHLNAREEFRGPISDSSSTKVSASASARAHTRSRPPSPSPRNRILTSTTSVSRACCWPAPSITGLPRTTK